MKPKVLVVDFVTAFGGVQRVMSNVMPHLERYVNIDALDALTEERTAQIYAQRGVQTVEFAMHPRIPALNWRGSRVRAVAAAVVAGPVYVIYLVRLAVFLARSGYHIIYTNSTKGLACCAVLKMLTGRLVVYHSHGFERPVGRLHAWLLGRADRVIAVSEAVRITLLGTGVPNEKIRLIYNGVECTTDTASTISSVVPRSSGLRCLIACNLHPGKGVHVAITAVRVLKDRGTNVQLDIAGDVPNGRDDHYKSQLQRQVQELDLEERVHFLGWIDDLQDKIGSSDILIMPSVINESFGMVLAEAMEMGKPVVGSSIGGIPEVVEDGVTGYLFDPGSSVSLADKIELLCDDELRKRLGANGARSVREKFSIQAQAEKIGSVLIDLSEQGGP